MSGLYIPDLELTESGVFSVGIDFTNERDKTVISVFRYRGGKPRLIGSYEAIQVPDHGRLIDADKLIPRMKSLTAIGIVNTAPTIIPEVKEET